MQLFESFFMGGFECSSHRRRDGVRLDMLAATGHTTRAAQDYADLRRYGIRAVRDGVNWPMIDRGGSYDWSSALPLIQAAQQSQTQVIWDLCHYGYPDDLDIWQPTFVDRLARFAAAFARLLADHTDQVPYITPINEISFFSWGGGDVGYLNPFAHGRGFELKVQLARATLAAIAAVRKVAPAARFVQPEPLINIVPAPDRPDDAVAAEGHRLAQFQAWDLLSGALWPQLGGGPDSLDILGVNYYHNNQWILSGPTLPIGSPLARPLSAMLAEVAARYGRPLFIAETGIEDDARPAWLRLICAEVRAALAQGTPVGGICLYPILNHPGWDDQRHCHNGLLDYIDASGQRPVYEPLANELLRQQGLEWPTRQ